MTEDAVLYNATDDVGVVTLNRPDKLNAINHAVLEDGTRALREADADPNTRVVVLRGAGRAFCAGYDITAELEGDTQWRSDPEIWCDYLHRCLEFEMLPTTLSKPVIASVRGHAVGGGCELTLFCDLTICADDAKFGEPEIRFSNSGPALIMPYIVGHKRARELLYFGDMIDAHTALECNMVNRVVAVDDLEEETARYAARLALIDEEALIATKQALRSGLEANGVFEAMRRGVDVLAPLYAAQTASGAEFMQIAESAGLGAALKWRMSQFE